jgi:single-strand DNA-binding protein
MASINKVVLMGYLCADPELKQTPSGVSVCSFRVGVSRQYKDADGNTPSDFIPCVVWRHSAEFLCKYFRKGSAVVVCGALQSRTYQDQQGQKRYLLEVIADEVQFGASKGSTDGAIAAPPAAKPAAPAAYTPPAQVPPPPTFEPLGAEDDLPF